MKKKTNNLSFLKAIAICHGKSEVQICKFIRSNLRLKLTVESDKNGEKSIQITSLMRILNGRKFRTINTFKRAFPDAPVEKLKLDEDFKIFTILDTDDCNDEQRKAYINKNMFKEHWAYQYIVPIYNSPNLEYVLKKSKIEFTQKSEYIKIFPTSPHLVKDDTIQVSEFYQKLKDNHTTNMDIFIKFCLDLTAH